MEWQQMWDTSTAGRWTHRLIPNISTWIDRKYGDVSHYLTQLLSGHGCFKAYQKRFHLDNDSSCPTCDSETEDARHVFFKCPRFTSDRDKLTKTCHRKITPESLVAVMLVSEENWDAVDEFAASIIKKLRTEERLRRGQTTPEEAC